MNATTYAVNALAALAIAGLALSALPGFAGDEAFDAWIASRQVMLVQMLEGKSAAAMGVAMAEFLPTLDVNAASVAINAVGFIR